MDGRLFGAKSLPYFLTYRHSYTYRIWVWKKSFQDIETLKQQRRFGGEVDQPYDRFKCNNIVGPMTAISL